jgi:hypothetical protein
MLAPRIENKEDNWFVILNDDFFALVKIMFNSLALKSINEKITQSTQRSFKKKFDEKLRNN